MKKEIKVFDYANVILTELKKGILITTKVDKEINTMAISWGSLTIEWNKNIFIVYIRESRHTKTLLDKNGEFTINIPITEIDKNIIAFTGSKSGRDIDKIKELNLTLVDSNNISVPAIKEFPLTLECKVIYKQEQDRFAIPDAIKDVCYDEAHGLDDYHTAYYGEILSSYIIES